MIAATGRRSQIVSRATGSVAHPQRSRPGRKLAALLLSIAFLLFLLAVGLVRGLG